jgi:hypothetical protein
MGCSVGWIDGGWIAGSKGIVLYRIGLLDCMYGIIEGVIIIIEM